MLLRKLHIENFRGISDLSLELDTITVLIGENNAGKTSILEAVHTCLSRGLTRRAVPFSEYDFHLANDTSEPSAAPPIAITLTFEESAKDEWPDEIPQAFPNVIQTLPDDRQQISFRVTSKYDKATHDFLVEWTFLDQAGNPLQAAKQPKLVLDLQQLAPVFLLSAVRDAAQHFHAKSSFWAPFTKNPNIDDEKRKQIEKEIEKINQSVLDAHQPFTVVKDKVAQTGKLLPLAAKDLVSVEAIPARIFDMLARTQVKLACRTGAKLPVTQHGAGTQSVSVLFLFEAFLQSRLAEAYGKSAAPILALEEPESHLHPSAVRALWPTLNGLSGQKLIATHSGDLLSTVPLAAIRRLSRRNGKVEVFRIKPTTLDATESRRVSYHVRAKRGALFFARCWLLVEGETEFTMIPELARILGHDFDLTGVCCVEFAQCGLKPLIKTAADLGIEWHLLADGDPAGQAYSMTAQQYLGASPLADRISALAEPDIEHSLWQHGHHAIYTAAVDAHHQRFITSAVGTPARVTETIKAAIQSTSKPHLAFAVCTAAAQQGPNSVPLQIKQTIEKCLQLASKST